MTIHQLPTPCYLVDEKLIERNLKILRSVIDRTGCRILLAQKAFSMFALYPLIGRYLCGTAASGLFEAKLGREEMPDGEVHTFSAAFRPDEIEAVAEVSDHIIFNSHAQLERYRETALAAAARSACGSTRCVRPRSMRSMTPVPPAPGWASRPRRSIAAGWRGSPACISTPSASRRRRARGDTGGGRAAFWRPAASNAVAQYGRRPPHHPPRL